MKLWNGFEHEGLLVAFLFEIALATIIYSTIEVSIQKVTSVMIKLWYGCCSMIDGKLMGVLAMLAKLIRRTHTTV